MGGSNKEVVIQPNGRAGKPPLSTPIKLEMEKKMSSTLWAEDPERWGRRGKATEFLESFTRK